MDSNDTKAYEFGFLLSSALNDAELFAILEKIEKIFTESGAKIIKKSGVERKILFYPIQKQKEANFCYFHFEVDPEKLLEIKDKFKYEANILRYLCLTPPPNFGRIASVEPHRHFSRDERKEEESAEVKEVFVKEKPAEEKIDLEGLDKKLGEIEELA